MAFPRSTGPMHPHRYCPTCRSRLSIQAVNGVEVDHCFGCGGTFLDAGEEAVAIGAPADPAHWVPSTASRATNQTRGLCPADGQPLHTHLVEVGEESVSVDLCYQCRGMWLDRGECGTLRKLVLRAGQKPEKFFGDGRKKFPFLKVYLVAALTGLPIESWNPRRGRPVATIAILISLVALFVLMFSGDPEAFGNRWGLSADTAFSEPWRIITYAFLHGGLLHLGGNAIFMWIFGDNVESYLGWRRYVTLYLVALVAAGLPTALGVPLAGRDAATVLVGASGAISGLLGAYLVFFPRVKLRVVWLFIPLRIATWFFVGVWIATQFALMTTPKAMIAWEAHLAGFLAGIVMAVMYRKKPVTGLHLATPPTAQTSR